MTNDASKQRAAEAALEFIEYDSIVGVGAGSTVNYFIDALARRKGRIEGAVAACKATAKRLKAHNIQVLDLNVTGSLPLYVDGADEANPQLQLIKGGGGALTHEKIIAAASDQFVCIADQSKFVDVLGEFPLPVEVIPMARSFVGREIMRRGGQPVLRENLVTESGNIILDVYNLSILEPVKLEAELNSIPGIVTVGLFALRPADVLLLGTADGVRRLNRD